MKAVTLILMLAAPLPAQGAVAGPPGEEQEQLVEFRGGWTPPPLRTLPFPLRLGPGRPDSLRDAVEKIYAALPEAHLARIASYYGLGRRHPPRGTIRTEEDLIQRAYVREILATAFRSWGYGDGNGPLGPAIACVGHGFTGQVMVQLAMTYIYGRPPAVRFRSELTRLAAQMDLMSRRIFDLCEERGSAGDRLSH